MKIACPKCDFRPTPNILWQCRPGCGYRWHTFATHGVCPGCSKFWHDTQCPRCRLWSPIDDWYREDVPERQRSVAQKQPVVKRTDLSRFGESERKRSPQHETEGAIPGENISRLSLDEVPDF